MKNNKNFSNKHFSRNPSAFSMIEISIVMVVITLLITTGIVAGQKMVHTAKLVEARSLTAKSPVGDIEGLKVWLETTRKDSFDDEILNGSLVSSWYSINNQPTSMGDIEAVQTVNNNKPIYTENAINGLPALHFPSTSGNKTYMNLPFILNPTKYHFSIFIVAIFNDSNGNKTLLIQQTGVGGRVLECNCNAPTMLSSIPAGPINSNASVSKGKAQLYTLRVNDYNKIHIGINDIENSKTAIFYSSSDTVAWYISRPDIDPMKGYIGEIIIYDRSLLPREREDIKKYLYKKWKIDSD